MRFSLFLLSSDACLFQTEKSHHQRQRPIFALQVEFKDLESWPQDNHKSRIASLPSLVQQICKIPQNRLIGGQIADIFWRFSRVY